MAESTRWTSYPGLGLPLRHYETEEGNFYPMGTHGNCPSSHSQLLPVSELAMMHVMELLTCKEDWNKKVFDEEAVEKWRKEALDIPNDHLLRLATDGKGASHWKPGRHEPDFVITEETQRWPTEKKPECVLTSEMFDHCIAELRSKAIYFEKSRLIPTLDASATVAKSDSLVSDALRDELRRGFKKLKADQAASPDWHPDTNEMVQDLVNPSLYPLVYDHSRVLRTESVGVSDAIDKWSGKGDFIPEDTSEETEEYAGYAVPQGTKVPFDFWSREYQWLPANVAFREDGSVKFTSYINNLHPDKYPELYSAIEKLIETAALPAWDQCLVLGGSSDKTARGRSISRFVTPENPHGENPKLWEPFDPEKYADAEIDWSRRPSQERVALDKKTWLSEAEKKWLILRRPLLTKPCKYEEQDYTPHEQARLSQRFKASGLQIIVKMTSIELTPEKPEFPAGEWHVAGQMNERICATALYYLDSDNITSSSLAFRMQTSVYTNEDAGVSRYSSSWLETLFGTKLNFSLNQAARLQNYGTVETCEGRLLAFPNVFHHRVSPFRLKDPSKPGHRRFIALWLVDPHQRIISTTNVPPQRLDWWVESAFGKSSQSKEKALSQVPGELAELLREVGADIGEPGKPGTGSGSRWKLPAELMSMVKSHFMGDLPMSEEEARDYRIQLGWDRAGIQKNTQLEWVAHHYSF